METRQSLRATAPFLVVAYLIAWLRWLPPLLASNGWVQLPEFVGILGMFGPFGPFAAALLLTGRQGGREAPEARRESGLRQE